MPTVMCDSRANNIAQMIARTLSSVDTCSALWWDPTKVSADRALVEISPDIIIYDNSFSLEPLQRHAYNSETSLRRVLIYCDDYHGEKPVPNIVVGADNSKSLRSVSFQSDLADLSFYRRGSPIEGFFCDVCLMTDYLQGDAREEALSSGIIPSIAEEFRLKAFGDIKLDIVNYLGAVNQNERLDVLRSSQTCLDFDGTQWRNILIAGSVPLVYKKQVNGGLSFNSFSELKDILLGNDLEYCQQKLVASAKHAAEANNFQFTASVIKKIADNSDTLHNVSMQLTKLSERVVK